MSYSHRIALTVWRKKSTALVASVLLVIIVFGLLYSKRLQAKRSVEEFVYVDVKRVLYAESKGKVSTVVAPVTKRRSEYRDAGQELGIPYVGIDMNNPYVPKERLVHFDLKGAPPKIGYIKKVMPMLKTLGATGILLEYEDMFPFEGALKNISAKNAYTKSEIEEILRLAEELKLQIIPLVQTFGHLEFALKRPDFVSIREVSNSPQALCPSKNQSLEFLSEMIGQILDAHPKIKYLHIGCDEVFQMGECELCRLELHDNLFVRHVQNVVALVHERRPSVRVIIWDDMLRHLHVQTLLDAKLGSYVEPMIWVYAEDIYRFVQPQVWEKYAMVFKTAWTASAFKGAFGETLYIPDVKRHLENNLKWLVIMAQQGRGFRLGFSGLVLTGWQRYDHFAVLCELLPAALPSLAVNLLAVSNGYFNASLKGALLSSLSCPQYSNRNTAFINLNSDPYLWEKFGRCMFPGSPFFRLTYRLNAVENEILDFLKVTTRSKGWLTEYNVRNNYSLPLRIEELTVDLPRIYNGAITIARTAYDAMNAAFDNYTIAEWIEQRVYPYIVRLERLQNDSDVLKTVNVWRARPLPPLNDLKRLGVM